MSRALIITLVVALVGGGAFYWYQQNQPPPPPPAVEEPPVVLPPRADQCGGVDASYALRSDPTVTLTMEASTAGRGPVAMMSQFAFHDAGHLTFVVKKPGKKEHRFVLLKSLGYTQNYLFPLVGGDRIEQPRLNDLILVSMFDRQYGYFPSPPIGDSASPQHIWAPGIARWLHPASRQGGDIEMDMAFFDFVACNDAATSPAPTPSQPPAQ